MVAKNPDPKERIAAGHKLTVTEQKEEYKEIVQSISPLVGTAGVSIEVFADMNTTGEEMLAHGIEMYTWIPNAYIKYPCVESGRLKIASTGPRCYPGRSAKAGVRWLLVQMMVLRNT